MPLSPGGMLSHYRLVEKIGEGGMGVVWKADDTVLGRQVAIKVLPDDFAQDAERLARFRQEARLLASLNHPNIAAIYGFEEDESDGVRYLVLELVPGQTLAEQLARGPLPVDEALTVCPQIAEALEAAHEKGIIHRDLKPGNVKVTPDGKVKVLDFGLAKAFEADATSRGDLSHSPTLTSPPTRAGVLLGTASYMSPEQARGRPLDKRTDIWSFGCVLYESLTGKQAFGGESITDVLAGIVKEDPAWERLPADTPPSIRLLLRRCLAKDPKTRLKDIGDAYWNFGEDDDAFSAPERGGGPAAISHRPRSLFVPIIVALALGAGLGWLLFHRTMPIPPETSSVARFSLSLPADAPVVFQGWPASSLAIAPNGSSIVYKGEDRRSGRAPGLYIRHMDELESRLISDTEDAFQPFFSPDGRWVAFFDTNGELRKISIDGGQPVTVARGIVGSDWSFGSWGDDGRIVFDEWTRGLYVVPAEGGEHRPLTPPSESEKHREPHVLPGSQAVLFTASTAKSDTIRALRLDDGAETALIENAYQPKFLASGHLLFSREGTLMVVPFDPQSLEIEGTPIPLSLNARIDSVNMASPKSQLAVSTNGTLVYAPADENFLRSSKFVWVDRQGDVQEERTVPIGIPRFTLAPDGRRALVADMQGAMTRIQVLDLERGTLDLLWRTRQPYLYGALWAPDGSVIHARTDTEGSRLLVTDIDRGTSTDLVQARGIEYLAPNSATRDNRFVSYTSADPETRGDIWVLDRGDESGQVAPVLFLGTPAHEYAAEFSPDGRWIAYGSDETGSPQVYLKRFPSGASKQPVSKEGGQCPLWSPDGREIFYQQAGRRSTPSGEWRINTRLMAVSVNTGTGLRLGEPRRLFEGPYNSCVDNGRGYEISPDGSRFLMVSLDQHPWSTNELVVVLNWFEELERLVPTGGD